MGTIADIQPELMNRPEPDLRPAMKELELPAGQGQIVLVNPDIGPVDRPFPNLVRRDAAEHLVWTAELPELSPPAGYDCYVDIRWADGGLAANSWSGYFVEIDPDTGALTSVEFTK